MLWSAFQRPHISANHGMAVEKSLPPKTRTINCSDWSSHSFINALLKIDLAALKTRILERERGRGRFSCLVVRRRRMRSYRRSAAKTGRQVSDNPEIRTKSEACVSMLLDAGDLPHSLP
jgi:hypothetical protein